MAKIIMIWLIALLALSVALGLGFRHATGFITALERSNEQRLVENVLSRHGEQTVTEQKVQLTWDETFRHAGYAVDARWADQHIGKFLYTSFRYPAMYLVDPKGRLLRGWRDGNPDDRGFSAVSPQIAGLLRELPRSGKTFGTRQQDKPLTDTLWPIDADGVPLTRWTSAQVRFEGGPATLTVVSVLPDHAAASLVSTPNYLITVRPLDTRYLSDLGKSLLLDEFVFTVSPPVTTGLNAIPIRDSAGRPLAWLNWRSTPHAKQIRRMMAPLFGAYLALLLAIFVSGIKMAQLLQRTLQRLREREAQALHEARHDAMTGLPNRGHFIDLLQRSIRRLQRDGHEEVVQIAFFDLDHFKYVNDTLGHAVGDELVKQVAERCRASLDPHDVIARLGGDEFVVMRITRRDAAKDYPPLGPSIMAVFAAPYNIGGRSIDVTASCGLSWGPDQGTSAHDLIRNADIALFRAKQRGRARWRAFTPDMEGEIKGRHVLEVELRKALHNESLSMVYQPVVDAVSGRIVSAEALLRWTHPELGAISPARFIPVAEQAGLMPVLGWWVMSQVFARHREMPQIEVAINLSPVQLMARGFLEDMQVLIEEYAINPRRICFEVTEGVLLERGTGTFEVLAGLKAMGFGIALDDFGTGYSSLSYLCSFSFDRIKIDRSFVQNIEHDLTAQSILKAIVSLSESVGAKTIAEGVETPLQRDLVVSARCDMIQGYFFHKPMPAEEIADLLSTQTPGPPSHAQYSGARQSRIAMQGRIGRKRKRATGSLRTP